MAEAARRNRVLIVDDDPSVAEMLQIVLRQEGFETAWCPTGDGALAAFRETAPDLVLLDLMLPGLDGVDVCRKIREESGVPIVMLTAKSDTGDVVAGLEAGADDYVPKPFKPRELVARVWTRLRRPPAESDSEILRIADLVINVPAHQVRRENTTILLTPLEFDLLLALARKPHLVFTREKLLEQVWGYRHAADTRLVNVHIQRLRSKIELDPEHPEIVVTVRGIGYRAGAELASRTGYAPAPRSIRQVEHHWSGPSSWAGSLLGLWYGSLPLRVVAATVAGAVIVLVLGGLFLLQQATDGVQRAKTTSATAEASVALDYVEQSLRETAGQPTNDTLNRVAFQAVQRAAVGGQYQVDFVGPVSEFLTPGLDPQSIPADLRETLRRAVDTGDPQMYVTSTLVRYTDGTPSVPGIVVASAVGGSGSPRYPVYFVFPMAQEQETLVVLQRAVLTTGVLILIALALIAYWVAGYVLGPVRQARLAAERLASGDLDDRMPVRGTDDLARLAVSMNFMASELQQRIDQLEELSHVQQRFVSDVSHELRTPLTTVRLAADVLYDARDDFEPLTQRSTELMVRELDRFEELLADLLEISRFDAGAAQLVTDESDVVELVRSEVEHLEPFAASHGSELRLRSAGSAVAEIDVRRVGRVLRNLLTNAIEHGEGKPVDVSVAADERAVAITVRDHGIGFSATEAEQVFRRFWRADPARSRRVGGTGLGLAISREDIRLHHGWLNAWGRPGQGALFRITVPRKQSLELLCSPLPMVPTDIAEGSGR